MNLFVNCLIFDQFFFWTKLRVWKFCIVNDFCLFQMATKQNIYEGRYISMNVHFLESRQSRKIEIDIHGHVTPYPNLREREILVYFCFLVYNINFFSCTNYLSIEIKLCKLTNFTTDLYRWISYFYSGRSWKFICVQYVFHISNIY